MGIFNMIVGTLIFILATVVIMQPLLLVLDATKPIMDTASNTQMKATDSQGNVVTVGAANTGGDLTWVILMAIGLFMTIGFIVWLIMRAPNMQDSYGLQDDGTGRFQ